jgi:nucleotide-binding universal stress UspA family protein
MIARLSDVMTNSQMQPDSAAVALKPHVLLATDGTPAARSATSVAAALAVRWAVSPHVVTVLPPPPVPLELGVGSITWQPDLEADLREEVDRQLTACSNDATLHWSRETSVGSPAREIVRAAERRKSDLIILGLRSHAFLHRVLRDETALSVMRHALVPVLAVTPLLTRTPRRIAVAVDFSRASIAAARAAINLLDDRGTLILVYAEPFAEPLGETGDAYRVIYTQGLADAFGRLRQELAGAERATVETVVLQGAVAPQLLSVAARADVDVIAVGSQQHNIAHRAFVGSVTTALARAASCSLLVVPPTRA